MAMTKDKATGTPSQKIEALLFVAGEAVAKKELAKLLNEPVEKIDDYLLELEDALHDRGLALVRTANRIQLVTSPHVATFLAQYSVYDARPLTRAASETLALVAYRGPISRYDIDTIRGVDSRSMLRQLLRRGLVYQIRSGGQTPLYDISDEFLLHVGLTRREQLPQFSELSNNSTVDQLLQSSE